MKNIVELFLNAATEYPDNIAIIEKNKQISCDKIAEKLTKHAMNCGSGDNLSVIVGIL